MCFLLVCLARCVQRIFLPVRLPANPLFAPTLNLTVRDTRLGGLLKPIVATAAVPLANKVWRRQLQCAKPNCCYWRGLLLGALRWLGVGKDCVRTVTQLLS